MYKGWCELLRTGDDMSNMVWVGGLVIRIVAEVTGKQCLTRPG